MSYSSLGKERLAVSVVLLLVDLVILALSTRVNQFQEFFFAADLFPLALSIFTLVVLSGTIAIDLKFTNAFTARAPFQIILFTAFSVIWLALNTFSTSRWAFIPLSCDSIPQGFAGEKRWCKDIQALKAFVWLEWTLFFLGTLFTVWFVVTQNRMGHKHIWSIPLSRYAPHPTDADADTLGARWRHKEARPAFPARDSTFLQYERYP